jgi:hypothetical protein
MTPGSSEGRKDASCLIRPRGNTQFSVPHHGGWKLYTGSPPYSHLYYTVLTRCSQNKSIYQNQKKF